MTKILIFLLSISFSIVCSRGLYCTEQYQCESVSEDYNYVICNEEEEECECLGYNRYPHDAYGSFFGNATLENKCYCPSNYTVGYRNGSAICLPCNYDDSSELALVYQDGQPYCIPTSYALLEQDYVIKARAFITSVKYVTDYNNKPERALEILKDYSLAIEFADDVASNVVPVGFFNGSVMTIGYFYSFTLQLNIVSTAYRKIGFDSIKNIVNVAADLAYYDPISKVLLNASIVGFYHFNYRGQIDTIDISVPFIGDIGDPYGPDEYEEQQAIINLTCSIVIEKCTGNVTQYNGSYEYCLYYLNTQMPFGSLNGVEGFTVMCRYVHSTMVAQNITVPHCAHAGAEGGGVCVPRTPSEIVELYYQREQYLFEIENNLIDAA